MMEKCEFEIFPASEQNGECPGLDQVSHCIRQWHSCIGLTLVWPRGSARFPVCGARLLNEMEDRKAYSVSVGAYLRGIAKAHEAWDRIQWLSTSHQNLSHGSRNENLCAYNGLGDD